MSFFRKSKKKTVDLMDSERAIDRQIETGNKLAQEARERELMKTRKEGEVVMNKIEVREGPSVSDEVSKERHRKKYKDMSGLNTQNNPVTKDSYPTFSVYYLGRIPTSGEYGREAVEEPVDQLCRMRDKQRLPRVHLCFDTEGLSFKEIKSSVFKKNKKEMLDMFIPLHHITYGVGSSQHPQVFACISRLVDDLDTQSDAQVLMLHAFLCEKEEVTQSITYWQLQAYIEAYEDLKRKKILRQRRKQALGSKAFPPEMGKRTSAREQRKSSAENVPAEDVTGHENGVPKPEPKHLFQNRGIFKDPPPPPENGINNNTDEQSSNLPKKGTKVKNKGYVKPNVLNEESKETSPSIEKEQTDPSASNDLIRSESTCSASSTGSTEGASHRDVAFERRIGELQTLMEMDAERLKKLMIASHASLAKQIYYDETDNNGPVPEKDVFEEDSQA